MIAPWYSLLAGSSLKMDRSAPGEGPKRVFSGIKKLRQSRSEAFSSENYAFFSVLALFFVRFSGQIVRFYGVFG